MEGHILTFTSIKETIWRYKRAFLALLGLIVGFSVSSGLLLYSGKELVNALVYLFFVVILPALFSIISFVVLLIKQEARVAKRMRESFLFGFFFSLGALVALLVTVTIKDIAFGWATTLSITPAKLCSVLNAMALWKGFCSSCLVDQELVSLSQITRLGGAVSSEQIAKAKELGQWWKFLAMSIVFYGILLRGLFWLFAGLFIKEKPLSFESSQNSDSFDRLSKSTQEPTKREALYDRKFQLLAYDEIDLESLGLSSDPSAKDKVVAVNAWEPPILEFFDYLEELERHGGKISLLLLGIDGAKPHRSDVAIWQDKLLELKKEYEVIV